MQTTKLILLVLLAFFTSPLVELAFPLVVLLFMPMRSYILPKIFYVYHLEDLDQHGGESALTNSNSMKMG